MPKIKVNDITMYYEQSGQGPDLVFISGLGVDHSMWDTKVFTDKFRVLTFDNRGIGQTDISDGPYTMQQFCEDTVSLCRALQIHKASFVGHSMGAHIAQYIAALYPEMVQKLVIACSEYEPSVMSEIGTKLQIELRQLKVPRHILVESYLPLLFSLSFLEEKNRVQEWVSGVLNEKKPQPDKGYIAQIEGLRGHNTKDLLAKIKSPTLVVGCVQDMLTPFKSSQYLKDHIEGAALGVIENCGHAPFIEKPKEFYDIILRFL